MMMEKIVELLLVEDNPADVELTLHALKKNNLVNNIQVARDGVEALDFLFGRGEFRGRSQYGPKLILLDLKLPRIDGLEVLKEIKQDPRTNKIPVVILTTSRQEIDIVRSYELGVNSYIVKPVDFEQFNEVVRQLGMYWMLLNQPPEL